MEGRKYYLPSVILYRLYYLFIVLPEHMLHRDVFCYQDFNLPLLGKKILAILPSPILDAVGLV